MRKIIIISLLIIMAITITGCTNSNDKFKLKIKESSWSGTTKDYEPEEVTKEYDVIKGKKYEIDSDNFTFTITKVTSKYIIIKTTSAFSDQKHGINLNSDKRKFKIYLDKELELTTPTTDAGYVYYLTLIKA